MMTTIEKITDPISQWYQGSGIHAFMVWWTGELKAMVPSQYRNNLFPDSIAVYVTEAESDEDEVSFWQQDGVQMQALQLNDAAAEKSWWHQLNHYLGTVEKATTLTNIQKIRLVEETLEREISPSLKKDGGDLELVDVDGNTVLVKLRGTCASCAASEVTLKNYVETKLREMVAPELVVKEVS